MLLPLLSSLAHLTELSQTGVTAKGYSVDLADAGAVQAAVATIQKDLGPIDVLFWNPVGAAAPFQKATPEQTMGAYNVTVTGEGASGLVGAVS
jgi:NAD(P)-dependent dehydrogenase (short-subunit alcohol dehydrogenase family)